MEPPQPTVLDPAAFTRFGELLRFLRLRAQLTQRELSIAVGYNFAQISRLESGQRQPDPVVVAATRRSPGCNVLEAGCERQEKRTTDQRAM